MSAGWRSWVLELIQACLWRKWPQVVHSSVTVSVAGETLALRLTSPMEALKERYCGALGSRHDEVNNM